MNKKRRFSLKDYPLEKRRLLLNETLFHNANGYIGIRYSFEEGYPAGYTSIPGQYINGFYDTTNMEQPERLYGLAREKQIMLNVAGTQTIKAYYDGEEFSMFSGTLLENQLTVDMERGVTIREVLWRSPEGKQLRLKVTRMASFCQLPLFTIDYEIMPINFSGNVILESIHSGNVSNYVDPNDPRNSSSGHQYLTPFSSQIHDGDSIIESMTSVSGLKVCSCVRNVVQQENQQEFLFNNNTAVCRTSVTAEMGKPIRLIKYAVFCDSIRYENCKEQAITEMERALAVPLEDLYKKQKKYFAVYWRNCYVQIDEKNNLNTALQFNLYQLIQSVGKDPYSNITPKGLSGEGYEGQFFWDTEMYIEPFFTITNPDISRNLISYRYSTLDYARANAKIIGHRKGALYPWRTIMGKECSGFFPSGSAQYHINGDIAYSIIAYYLATKDTAFILQKGAEILIETARLWLDTGNFHEGKFHINDVTGPDEYTCIVNNNYYTNVLAQFHLRWVVKFYNMLKGKPAFKKLVEHLSLTYEEIEDFEKAADNMFLPYDETLKINPQDDSFLQKKKLDIKSIPEENFPLLMHYHPLHLYRHQVCKQADTVMAHFILEDAQDEETIRNSFLYYEQITTHDSSLSECVFSIIAARLGYEAKAFDYFNKTLYIDLADHYKNSKDGIHIANMGGNYLAIVYGFGGFRLKEKGISFAPILPSDWTGYRFKIRYERSRIAAYIEQDSCRFHLESGAAKKITVYGREYLLTDTLVINTETKALQK